MTLAIVRAGKAYNRFCYQLLPDRSSMGPREALVLLTTLVLLVLQGTSAQISSNDLLAHSLLVQLNDIHSVVTEVRLDVTHKIGHLDSSQHYLHQVSQQLKAISLEHFTLHNLTPNHIQNTTNSARLSIKEVQDQLTDLKNLQQVISKLKEVEINIKELEQKIEEELERQESETSSAVLQQQIAKLAEELKKQQEKEADRLLPYDAIEAIQIKDFRKVEEILNLIHEDVKITLIVRQVYNHQPVNFDLLADFAKFLKNATKTYLVTKALKDQLDLNHHGTILRTLDMKKIVDPIELKTVEESSRSDVDALKNDLKKLVETLGKEELKHTLQKNTAEVKNNAKEIFRKVYDDSNDVFRAVVVQAMDDSYMDISTDRWLEFARDAAYIEQIIIVSVYVWQRMQQHSEMSTVAVIDMGFTVRETTEQDNYSNVKEELRKQLENIKDNLPYSVKNAVFSATVCLKSVKYNEYLYAPIDNWKYDEDRRNVFTWGKGSRVESGGWRVERDGNRYYIKNLKYDEYLYAAGDGFIRFDRHRSIFTWRRGGRVVNGVWWIEPEGEDCYIKITEFKEYLIAGDDGKKWDNDRRRVFSALGGKKPEEAKWRIEDC